MKKPWNFSIILLEQTVIRRETPVILFMTQMYLSHGAETKEHALFIDHNHQVVFIRFRRFFYQGFWVVVLAMPVFF